VLFGIRYKTQASFVSWFHTEDGGSMDFIELGALLG